MGVLDDAIREHIELKRRHGASEQDLIRQEQEALGPARRGVPAADAPAEAEDDAAAAAEEHAPEAPQAGDDQPTEVVAAVPEPGPEPFSEADPLSEPEPEPFAEPDAPAEPDALAEPAPGEPADDGEEDVLEETPEFLQETPEHDRLWFEQKPPRDFDFDE